MIVLAREVFLCRASTDVEPPTPRMGPPRGLADTVTFRRGGEQELELLDRDHDAEHKEDFRGRLAQGEWWVVGLAAGQIVTYTWLHQRPRIEYRYLPGCTFSVGPGVAYGYDAWTAPPFRGAGLRRRAFVEELRVLRSLGALWETSFFVKHQLEGAQRSLGQVGIVIEPLWHVRLRPDRTLATERLAGDDSIRPAIAA